jgi:hypothetical protein
MGACIAMLTTVWVRNALASVCRDRARRLQRRPKLGATSTSSRPSRTESKRRAYAQSCLDSWDRPPKSRARAHVRFAGPVASLQPGRRKAAIKSQGNFLDETARGFFFAGCLPLPASLACSGRQPGKLTRSRLLRGFANPRGGLRLAASASLEFLSQVSPGRGARRSGRQLFGRNIDGTDVRPPVEQFLGPAEQGGGDSALKMRLAGLVAAEAVKDSKSPLIDPEGIPGNRSGLLGDETEGACKKRGDLFFLPRLWRRFPQIRKPPLFVRTGWWS